MEDRKFETLAIHAGAEIDPATKAVTSPIYPSTTFEREADGSYPQGYSYTRSGNPNRAALEHCLSTLEGGAAAAAFSSGSAAAASIFRALSPGDHVLAPDDMYHGIVKMLTEVFIPWGLKPSFVDFSDLANVRANLRHNTKLIWLETPSNPLLKITDIEAVAELARSAGALLACDNTWTPPALQPVFALGADLIMHASTKYLAGHSDVLGGVVLSRRDDEFFARIRNLQVLEGAVPSPFDCWLTLRGIKTLPYRMRAHCEHAALVAEFLSEHPRVARVYYPGLASHPGHELAAKQMRRFGGMLSFTVTGGQEEAMALAARVKLFTRATSLGGVESLIEHRASIEGPDSKTPQNLLRLSVGLEHPDDLIADLRQALDGL